MKAILSGKPTNSYGCQALLRGLPLAAMAGPRNAPTEQLQRYARRVAELTHRHPRGNAAVHLATEIAIQCLRQESSVLLAIRAGMEKLIPPRSTTRWSPPTRPA